MKKSSVLFVGLMLSLTTFAQITEKEVDVLVENTMKAFNVPGIAVGIIKDGKLVLAKGYGVSNINTKQKVDANTLFGVASNSKAFTAAALAILVDEGKLNWDDKVIQYLPEFKMYNEYVTNEFTIRDLLTHKSGLGLGAGDLMIWPDGHNFTPKDIIKNIQYLKPVSGFRTKYDYDNLLYVIAGEVVEKVSGKSWCDFVEQRLMFPIGMTKSAASYNRLKDTTNIIVPHVPTGDKLEVIKRYTNPIFDAAAGLYTSVNDLSNWLIVQMNKGKYAEGKELFTEKQWKEMWTSQTILPKGNSYPFSCNFKTYGLGWQLTDVNGHLQVSHTGGLDGIVTQTIMIPDINLGIIVLTNQQSGTAFTVISNTIKASYMNLPKFDHLTYFSQERKLKEDDADKITDLVWDQVQKNSLLKIKRNYSLYTGTFYDNWFGEVTLYEQNGKLYFASKRSPRLTGEVFFYKDQNFVVKWNIRSFHADAHIFFDIDSNGNMNHFTMKAISPLTDFSYDFHDLDFLRK